MRMRAACIPVLLLAVACNNGSADHSNGAMNTTSEQVMDSEALQRFGADYTAAWSSGRPDRVASFFAPDGSLTVNKGTPAIGTEAIAKVAEGFMTALPDMVLHMDSLVVGPNGPAYHWTLIGTNTGPNGTGNKVRISGVERWTMSAEGGVHISDGSFDAAEYDRQIARGVDASQ